MSFGSVCKHWEELVNWRGAILYLLFLLSCLSCSLGVHCFHISSESTHRFLNTKQEINVIVYFAHEKEVNGFLS